MPNNFKLTGDYYVSKAGNDANDGLTPETPKLTVQAALNLATTGNKTIIVGSGVYAEVITKAWNVASGLLSILGDGTVILDGINSTSPFSISVGSTSSSNLYIKNIRFKNYSSLLITLTNANIQPSLLIENCVIDLNLVIFNGSSNSSTFQYTIFRYCTFLNTSFTTTNQTTPGAVFVNGYFQFYNSILINCATSGTKFGGSPYSTNLFLNNYVDANTVVWANPSAANFNFNNIQGKIVMPISGAVSGVNSNGVALTLAQHRIDYPTYNVNSFSSDPKFNNPRLLDFTLQAGSPNVSASSDYVSNIGGTEYAVPFTASSAAFTTNATSQSLEYRGIYYAISGSATTGSITSGPMFLQWPRTKPLTSVNWIGALEFNKTITASLAGNNNVPAYTTFTSASGLAGANPDRLKIRLRYSTQQTQPSTDAEWDNGGYWTAGTYQLFEPNTKPKVDYKGTGNGDPTYVETSAIGDLVPSWIQTQIILRNDYNR